MSRHRFVELVNPEWSAVAAGAATVRSTGREAHAGVPTPLGGFVVCPLAVQQWLAGREWQWQIYQRAWEATQALAVPSVVERFQAELVHPN